MYTRRDFTRLSLAGIPLAAAIAKSRSDINGVKVGVQTYSYRSLGLGGGDVIDKVVSAIKEDGLGECELFAPQIEAVKTPMGGGRGNTPEAQAARKAAREELRKWRLETPASYFQGVRKKFNDAGINIHGFNYSFRNDFTDEEIDHGFDMAKALGAKFITASTTLPVAKRVAPFADKHKMIVSMHGHSNLSDPNEFAKPESFEAAMAMSKHFWINLDIGHFTAAGYDPIEYIKQHHDRITNIHLKDRKKGEHGDNVVWGQGETPIKQVLQLLKKEKYPIYADIEYEYKGAGSPVEEVAKCVAYIKEALA